MGGLIQRNSNKTRKSVNLTTVQIDTPAGASHTCYSTQLMLGLSSREELWEIVTLRQKQLGFFHKRLQLSLITQL